MNLKYMGKKELLGNLQNKFLLDEAHKRNMLFLIKSTLQYPKYWDLEREKVSSRTSVITTNAADTDKWVYNGTL
jgi:hypothetical protein